MQKKIVLIGGPGTGKSTVLQELKKRNYHCMPEVSREVTAKAQKRGIQQLFLKEPLLFSKLLLEGREKQYLEASKSKSDWVFFDRGLPDIHAYMDHTNDEYPTYFLKKSLQYKYDYVFLFKPWKDIYVSDQERYESFKESVAINDHLIKTYKSLGYSMTDVPFGSADQRADFMINWLNDHT